MADTQRIDDLRRRVQKDPASIAFAQLAEECRRAGRYDEAVAVCQGGLTIHPGYLSARVTLGRALIELNDLDAALGELTTVLKSAPENLAAIRGVAEIHHRRGELGAALAHYRAALALARNDPDLQETVADLTRQVEPPPPPAAADGLSFEQMQHELLNLAPPPARRAQPAPAVDRVADKDTKAAETATDAAKGAPALAAVAEVAPAPAARADSRLSAPPAADEPSSASLAGPADTAAARRVAALQQFLDAVYVARADRGA